MLSLRTNNICKVFIFLFLLRCLALQSIDFLSQPINFHFKFFLCFLMFLVVLFAGFFLESSYRLALIKQIGLFNINFSLKFSILFLNELEFFKQFQIFFFVYAIDFGLRLDFILLIDLSGHSNLPSFILIYFRYYWHFIILIALQLLSIELNTLN